MSSKAYKKKYYDNIFLIIVLKVYESVMKNLVLDFHTFWQGNISLMTFKEALVHKNSSINAKSIF